MLYLILGMFFALGVIYPIYNMKADAKAKEYFMKCLELDIYYPDTDYITQHEYEEPVKTHIKQMLELAQNYMKNPEFENEYLRIYKIGFEIYKQENLEDLEAYLQERHERNMANDPEYAAAYAAYAKLEKKDFGTKIYRKFMDVKRKKPNIKIFRANMKKIQERDEQRDAEARRKMQQRYLKEQEKKKK